MNALELYLQGLHEKDTLVKSQAFNHSIQTLLNDKSQDDALMAANLVQLRQYPLAVYYYMKTLKKDPSNPDIRTYLNEIIKAEGLPTKIPPSSDYPPSSWLIAAAFILWALSFSLWIHFRKKAILLISFPLLLGLLTLISLSYRSPILAVVLHAQVLFQAPQSEPVSPKPIPAGLIVTVLDVQHHGSWLKIHTQDGVMGYLPENALRIVD